MDGTETKDDLDRCKIWDVLFNSDHRSVGHIAQRTKIHANRVRSLVEHPWFTRTGPDDDSLQVISIRRGKA